MDRDARDVSRDYRRQPAGARRSGATIERKVYHCGLRHHRYGWSLSTPDETPRKHTLLLIRGKAHRVGNDFRLDKLIHHVGVYFLTTGQRATTHIYVYIYLGVRCLKGILSR